MCDTRKKDPISFVCVAVSLFSKVLGDLVKSAIDRIVLDRLKVCLIHVRSESELDAVLEG